MIYRGIARSIPPGVPRGSLAPRVANRTFATRQQFPQRTGILSGQLSRARLFAAAGSSASASVTLGSVASSRRQISVWGWGGSNSKGSDVAGQSVAEATQQQQQQEQQNAFASAVDSSTNGNVAAKPLLSEPPVPTSDTDMQSILDSALSDQDLSVQDIFSMSSHQLGYLEAVGVSTNNLWPSGIVGTILEHVHVFTGLGWAGSILLTSILIRLALVYPQIKMVQNTEIAAASKLDPRFEIVKQQKAEAVREKNIQMTEQTKAAERYLRKEHGLSSFALGWIIPQVYLSVGFFNLLRNMVAIPVPGLDTAGFLWLTDLTARDPFFILPIATGTFTALGLLVNRKHSEGPFKIGNKLLLLIGILVSFTTCWISASLNVLGVGYAFTSLVINLALANTDIRRRLGLKVESKPGSTASGTSQQHGGAAQYMPPRQAAVPKTASASALAAASASAMASDTAAASALTSEADAAATKDPFKEQPALSTGARLAKMMGEAKSSMSGQFNDFTRQIGGTEAEKAEKKRKNILRKLEDMRLQQAREQFDKRFKRK